MSKHAKNKIIVGLTYTHLLAYISNLIGGAGLIMSSFLTGLTASPDGIALDASVAEGEGKTFIRQAMS